MKNVIMIGNSPKVKGGITTVINQFKSVDWKLHNINMTFISSYSDRNVLFKIIIYIFAIIRLFIICLFKKIDIIHVHMSYKGSFIRAYNVQKIAKFFRIKFISHMHGSEFEKWYNECSDKKKNRILKYLKRCDNIIVLGNEWSAKFKKIYDTEQITVIPNCIELPNELAMWSDVKRILFLGVLIERKGVKDLLNAVNNIKKLNNIEIAIAGTGNQEKELKNLSNELGLNDKVKFIGWIDSEKKHTELLNSQALILPSYNEGLPMSILEAMSYGLPIISSNVGDIKTVVYEEKNGFLFNPGDINQISLALEKINYITKDEWNEMSNYSRNIIEKGFSLDKYIKKILDIYS